MAGSSELRKFFPVVVAFLCMTSFEAAKLNVPKVLLPCCCETLTEFILEVDEGCFTWRSSRPHVATVKPIGGTNEDDCTQSAAVIAVSKTPHRMTSVITAEQRGTGQTLRCDVIVDTIHNISVETTTKELFMEDSPERLPVVAVDDKGNTFSSLEGLKFEWNLVTDRDVPEESIIDAHSVLSFQTFTQSAYETPPHIGVLESKGLQGDVRLVEGIRTGVARVTAKLLEEAFLNVPEANVRLVVIANVMVVPSEVYIMPLTSVDFRVMQFKQGSTREVTMPNNQYYLELEDGVLCSLDHKLSRVRCKDIGDTELVLKDKNINLGESFSEPTSLIHVVHPKSIGFDILPGRKWNIIVGREYEIFIEIYEEHKIHISDQRMVAKFPSDYLQVLHSSENGTYHIVRTLQPGRTEILASLVSIILEDGTESKLAFPIDGAQNVELYSPVQVTPSVVAFPWHPVTRDAYFYTLQATGGSGSYDWSSSRVGVVSVNNKGQLSTLSIGSSTVTAADVKNAENFDTARVHVLPPSDMKFLPSPVEAEIGSNLQLPLAVFGLVDGHKVAFKDCRKLPLNITVVDGSVFGHHPESTVLSEGSCTSVKVEALRVGFTQVIVAYTDGKTRLQAAVTVAAYKPLTVVDPEGVAVVTVGSSKEIIVEGGPQPWVLDPSKYYEKVVPEDSEVVSIQQSVLSGRSRITHSFRVLCRDLKEQQLQMSVGNGPTTSNQFPAVSQVSLSLACSPPASLYLQPVIRRPSNLPPCPIAQDANDRIPVDFNQDLEIDVIVTDNQGRRFHNFSSLAFNWDLTNEDIASLKDPTKLTVVASKTNAGYPRAYQVLIMMGRLGSLVVTATISTYDEWHFTSQSITFDRNVAPPISRSLELMLVEGATIEPSSVSLFNHPSSKIGLSVIGGSGHFHVLHEPTGLIGTTNDPETRKILVVPFNDGDTKVTAFDLCLEAVEHAHAHVHVSGVHSIDLKVLDKVEVHHELHASAQLLDERGRPLPTTYLPFMNLRPKPGSEIISIRPDPERPSDGFTVYYIVRGVSLGVTTLTVVATPRQGQKVSSAAREIQVFPPLRLNPRNITMIIGSLFQVSAYGGPQPQSSVEFSLADSHIASISSSGLIDAQNLGDTRVIGKAVGRDSVTGETIVYSQDEVTVYVVELTGIKIFTPLTRLQTGSEMQVYATGVNDQISPFTFGSAIPGLFFHWSVTNKEVISLKSVYHKSDIVVGDVNNFAMRLLTKSEGYASVKLQVTVDRGSRLQIKDNVKLSDDVQIRVFEQLRLLNPLTCGGQLLITPNTEMLVKTNREGSARLEYSVLDLDPSDDIVTCSKSGLLVSGSKTGIATLIVTALEDFGVNHSLAIIVKVKSVAYLMLNADTVLKTQGHKLPTLPVGSTLLFSVSFHDDIGERFHATNIRIKYRPNRFDLMQIGPGPENATLVARATDMGQTVLKVWDEDNPRLADYISIEVGQVIHPRSIRISLGDVVCFNCPLVNAQGYKGVWSSTGIALDVGEKGISTATAIGSSVVTYNVSSTVATYTEVSVEPVRTVTMDTSAIQSLTNVDSDRRYSIPVVLGSQGNLKGPNCSAVVASANFRVTSVPFQCQVTMTTHHQRLAVSDLFSTEAVFDAQLGSYVCRLTPQHTSSEAVSSLETLVQIQALLPSGEHQPQVLSSVVSIPFLPAFTILTQEVVLSNLQPLSGIRLIVASSVAEHLQLHSSRHSLVEILALTKDEQSDNVMLVPVQLKEDVTQSELSDQEVLVQISCEQTGQRVEVVVKFKWIGQRLELGMASQKMPVEETGWAKLFQVVANNYQTWIFLLLCLVATLGAIIIAYQAVLGSRSSYSQPDPSIFLRPGSPPAPYYGSPQAASPKSFIMTGGGDSPQLWSTGYSPQESMYRRSPHNNSSY